MTTNALPLCPQCGHSIPADAANGLCPRCVFAKALVPTADDITIPHVPPSLEPIRAAFPHLEVIGLIGSGGMGSVFKARQPQLDRFVALKILPSELADHSGFSARFQREARALAKLSHPHIVTVHDFGQAGGFFYLLMEFVDGVNLRQLLQSKRLTPKEALSIVPPICEALQCAHEHGIVHRDIKPENLLIDKTGVVKIADFGIAKMILSEDDEPARDSEPHTAASASLPCGTPDYAAPEQSSGNADHRADIYSLGVVLYEMLTGERPTAKLEAPSKRVQVDIRIDEIVLRALEKTPELRFATAADFRTQVEALVKLPELPPIDYSKFNRDPANWHFYCFYFCREDPRLIVPKRIAGFGWTVNLARPLAIPFVAAVCGALWSALELARDRDPLHAYDKWTLVAVILGLAFLCHRLSNPSPSPQHSGWLELPNASSWARRYLLLPSCLAGGAYAAHLFYVISTAARLPDRVATHFGKSGLPNGWMTKTGQLAFMGLMPVGMTAFLGLALWINIKNPTLLSLPNRDFWLAPERRKRTAYMLGGTNLVLSAILTGFMSTLNHVILNANSTQPPKLASSALLLPVIFLLSLLALWAVSLSFRFAHKDEAVLAPPTPRKSGAFRALAIMLGLGLLIAADTYLRSPTVQKESRVDLKYIDATFALDHIKAEHPELANGVIRAETNGIAVTLDPTSANLAPLQKYLAEIDHPPEAIVLSGIVTEFLPNSPDGTGKVVAKPTVYTLLGNDSRFFVGAKDGLRLEFTIKTSKNAKKGDESFVLEGTVTESMRDAPAQAGKVFPLPTLHAPSGGSVVFTHRLQDGRDIGLTIKLLNVKPSIKTPAAVLGTSAR